jgi:hypothetical protein
MIDSTNPLVFILKEVKWGIIEFGIFPDRSSGLRLCEMNLDEIDGDWLADLNFSKIACSYL